MNEKPTFNDVANRVRHLRDRSNILSHYLNMLPAGRSSISDIRIGGHTIEVQALDDTTRDMLTTVFTQQKKKFDDEIEEIGRRHKLDMS